MRVCFLFLVLSFLSFGQIAIPKNKEKIEVEREGSRSVIISSDAIFLDQWHCLPQPMFWKQIMLLSPDSCLINISDSRIVLEK
jgi:hypothetical protein